MMVLADMMGTCKFGTQYNHPVEGIHIPQWKDFIKSATGRDYSENDLRDAARRVMLLERCYNTREGLRRMDDYPFYLWWEKKYGEPHPVYSGDQIPLTEENYDRVLNEWYTMRGIDLKSGIPTAEELRRCGLDDVEEDLVSRKILQEPVESSNSR